MEKGSDNASANAGTNLDNNLSLDAKDFEGLGAKIDDKTIAANAAAEAAKVEADKKAEADKAAAEKLKEGENGKSGTGTDSTRNTAEAVAIDGVDYKLDKDGNALGADGKVFKTKDELAALTSEEPEGTLVDDFIKVSGFQPKDEKGQPKVYEETVEGMIALAKDTAEAIANQRYQQRVEATPGAKKYFEYLERGGDPREYHKQMSSSWKAVKLDPKNEGMLINAVVSNLMKAGISREDAEVTANLYKDTSKLEAMGVSSYKALVAAEDAREASEKAEFESKTKANEEALEKHWNTVSAAIKKGTIDKIVIPETERDSFYKYLAVPVDKERNSQADLDEMKMEVEQWLQLKYFQFKGGDLSKLVANTANTLRTTGLKSRLKSGSSGVGGGTGADKARVPQNGAPNLEGITMDNFQVAK